MRYRVLGPIRVVAKDETELTVSRPMARALLAILLLDANRVIAADVIADRLWDGRPPSGWVNTLQAHVAHLRRALRADGTEESHSPLITRSTGYELVLADQARDSDVFERGIGEARRAQQRGDYLEGRLALGVALEPWAGEPYEEFADRSWAQPEVSRLVALRQDAIELSFEAALVLGQHLEIVTELEGAREDNPLRERLTFLHMLALYRCGRQADAFRALRSTTEVLRAELGVDPGPELRRLERLLLAHDSSLDWVPIPMPSCAMPASLAWSSAPAHPKPTFVGREHELARLREAWQFACSGTARLLLLSGEPGIGKTRLASQFAQERSDAGVAVVWGRAVQEAALPYHPLREALGSFADLRSTIEASMSTATAMRASDLAGAQQDLFERVVDRIRALGGGSPVLMVLDDLQWADSSSILFLRYLVRHSAGPSVLVIGTVRDAQVDPRPSNAIATTLDARDFEILAMGGLERESVAQLLMNWSETHVPDAVSSVVRDRTGGNPFFIEALLSEIDHETEGIPPRSAQRRVALERLAGTVIPERVRGVIDARMERLGPRRHDLLRVAAVLGRDFEPAVVGMCADADDAEVVDALEAAEGLRLVTSAPDTSLYSFPHALVRDAILISTSRVRRTQIHRKVAAALERLGEQSQAVNAAELSHHYLEAADPASLERSIHYARVAARRAIELLGHEEALRLLESAVPLLDRASNITAAIRVELLVELGDARYLMGDLEASKAAFVAAADLARTLRDGKLLARVAVGASGLGISAVWSDYGVVSEATVGLLQDALMQLGAEPECQADRALLLSCLAQELRTSGARDEIQGYLGEAVRIARRLDDPAVLAHALAAKIRTDWRPETLSTRLADSREMLAAAQRCGGKGLQAIAHGRLATQLLEACRIREAEREIAALARLAKQLSNPLFPIWSLGLRGTIASLRGGFADAERLVEEAAAVSPEIFATVEAFAGVYCSLRIQQGRAAEVVDVARGFVDTLPHVAAWRAGLSALLVHAGDFGSARREATTVLDGLAAVRRDQDWPFCMAALTETCGVLDDVDLAEPVYEALSGFAGRMVVLGDGYVVWSSVDRLLGTLACTLGRLDAAEAHLTQAIEIYERVHAPPLLNRARYELARVHYRSGDHEAALTLLDAARSGAEALGQIGLLNQIALTTAVGIID